MHYYPLSLRPMTDTTTRRNKSGNIRHNNTLLKQQHKSPELLNFVLVPVLFNWLALRKEQPASKQTELLRRTTKMRESRLMPLMLAVIQLVDPAREILSGMSLNPQCRHALLTLNLRLECGLGRPHRLGKPYPVSTSKSLPPNKDWMMSP